MFHLSLDDLHKKDHTIQNMHHPFKRNDSILTHVQREIGAWLIEEGGMHGRIQRCKVLLLSCQQ
jgi:hypothetical protein